MDKARSPNTDRKKCSYEPITQPTIFKPTVSVRFAYASLQVVLSAIKVYWTCQIKEYGLSRSASVRHLTKNTSSKDGALLGLADRAPLGNVGYWHKADIP